MAHTSTNDASPSPPLTPAYTTTESKAFPTPQSVTTAASSAAKAQEHATTSTLPISNTGTASVNYPAFEIHERPICLSRADQDELYRKHKLFKMKTATKDGSGCISDVTKHIPYSSDKKGFGEKTGRDGFNVFEYSFQLPDEGDGKPYTVMWDYENGLVRITPFFKACKYSKTTPAKALSTNAGVKELSHSITGGALTAQGYWLPYQCARAICLTFCWHIRWPLVHIFGPSFIRECLPPSDPNFGKFKISQEIVRCATLEVEAWKPSPTSTRNNTATAAPRSTPAPKALRPRSLKPPFKPGSPFDSSSSQTSSYRLTTPLADSPGISPKSAFREHAITSSGWTSVNRPYASSSLPEPPHNTPVASLADALLAQPRYASWRPAEGVAGAAYNAAHNTQHSNKRRRSHSTHRSKGKGKADTHTTYPSDDHTTSDADISQSESESDDIDISPPPPSKKRARYQLGRSETEASSAPPEMGRAPPEMERKKGGKSKRFTAEDARAAQWLLNLHYQDAGLARGPDGVVRTNEGVVEKGGRCE
ncbi:uncharacterized protein LTR77_000908 [Saxophila tyrrhenica]|uniref:HTH APSES-type domain-containing protein n=1 Tax=Saxophila tyrrhenica TaxID=1690608 RepID=A0AAV9PTV5_9PEZI|nr:hypothetical protein LTR77_000908 [Saxophila tyrrhenica]